MHCKAELSYYMPYNQDLLQVYSFLSGHNSVRKFSFWQILNPILRLLKCAAGHEPISQTYTQTTRKCRVSFDREHCVGCLYQDQCRPKIYKKVATFITSKNACDRAKSQRYMQSGEKQQGKFFFGSKKRPCRNEGIYRISARLFFDA